jgi:hypothetical protein
MKKVCLSLIATAVVSLAAHAQVSISAPMTATTITFDSTLSGVNNGPYGGSGLQATPAAGQLDSDAWAVTGWSDGDLAFGGTRTTASTDYTRGNTSAAVTTGGMYAFGSTDRQLMIQPGGSDWAPGTLTLKITNNTGAAVKYWTLGYELYVRNDQARSNSFNFSFSTDNVTYTPVNVGNFQYTSTAAIDPTPVWALISALSTTVTTGGSGVASGSSLYIRWSGADVGGSGSRDEFGIDDVAITAIPEPSKYAFAITALLGVLILIRRRQIAR